MIPAETYSETTSVVLRYAGHLSNANLSCLQRTSLREGARVLRLGDYREATVDLLDLSTLSTTGTFKDWVACVTVAGLIQGGQERVLTQTSGNTGNALARYASGAGLRCVVLYPPESRRRVLPSIARSPGVRFVEVDAPESQIKRILRQAADELELPSAPVLDDQLEGNKLRAYFLRDAARELGCTWDWHVQALSSAYGPLGFYRGMDEIRDGAAAPLPRLLGIQQQAVATYARELTEWKGDGSVPMLEPTLFRRALTPDLIQAVRDVCDRSGGTVRCLPNARYLAREREAVERLGDAGIEVTLEPCGAPRERSGLYSVIGTLEAIDEGLIGGGEKAIAVYTGGSGPSAEPYVPEYQTAPEDAVAVIAAAFEASQ